VKARESASAGPGSRGSTGLRPEHGASAQPAAASILHGGSFAASRSQAWATRTAFAAPATRLSHRTSRGDPPFLARAREGINYFSA
jgi:hypothetical protein